METSNEKIRDAYIRHQIYLIKYAGYLRNQVTDILDENDKALQATIMAYASDVQDQRLLTGAAGRQWQFEFKEAVKETRTPAWKESYLLVQEQFNQLAVMEAATAASTIQSAVPVALGLALPPPHQLKSIVASQPFQGKTLKEWMDVTERGDVERALTLSKIGITNGVHPRKMAREVTQGLGRRARKNMEAVLLTVTNGIQQEAKQALYEANSDLIKEEGFFATLDIRTTIECADNDGKLFKRGKGPIPPLHFRCRSKRVPIINPENLGNRPINPSNRKQYLEEYCKENNLPVVKSRDALPRGFKTNFDSYARKRVREVVGSVPARTTYTEFLRKQDKSFQDQVLGPTRAELFRSGKVKDLGAFVDNQGSRISLEELAKEGIALPSE